MSTNVLNRISFLSLFLLVVLLPLFCLPFTNISVESGKGFFLAVGLTVSVVFWAMARFSDGKLNFPKSMCLIAGGGVVLVTLFSALFSGASQMSLFGVMFDIGSFWFVFSSFVLMLMSSITFRDPKSARMVLFGVMLSSAIVLVFQALHLFFPQILSLSILSGKTDNVLGSWNALGIFIGFYVICSLLVVEFFPVARRLKLMLGALVLLGLAFIAVVNFTLIWEILGIFALLIFIYKISVNSRENYKEDQGGNRGESIYTGGSKARFPALSFIVVLVALLFFTSSRFVGGVLPNSLGVLNSEVGPSFLSTMSVTKSVIRAHPALGIGPNRFAEAWALYKPAAINQTAFWDFSFNSGFGILPTLTATTGVLGVLAWAIFFVLFLFTGIKRLFSGIKNSMNLEVMSFFILSLYLLFASFFYFTGTVIFLLAFVFVGVSVGLFSYNRSAAGRRGEVSISFLGDHRKTFFFMLFLILLVVISVTLGFKYVQRFVSVPYFSKTLGSTTIEGAQASIGKALALHTNDLYLRTYSQIYLTKLNSTVSKGASSLSEADKAGLQLSLTEAVNGAQAAVKYNPRNYLNYQMLGTVYQTAGLIGVKEAYTQALSAYQSASALNPANPRLKLALSGITFTLSNTAAAKDYANQALLLKPDYIDALITLSQIAKSEGDNAAALMYAERALAVSPLDDSLINYTESLRNGSVTPSSAPSGGS